MIHVGGGGGGVCFTFLYMGDVCVFYIWGGGGM